MSDLSHYAFVAALAAALLAFGLHLMGFATTQLSFAGEGPFAAPVAAGRYLSERYASILTVNAFLFLTASLVLRALASGHAPFSNMFEFSMAFGWGALGFAIYFETRYRVRTLTLLVIPIVVGLLAYATTVPSDVEPLSPALQNSVLLTAHVALAILAYGAFAVAFAAGVLYLIQGDKRVAWLPGGRVLDEIGYKAVMLGFPTLALAIILGAVWADIAWGSYWQWDPKETASLAAWLIYGGYLHARVVRGWQGRRSAYLLILGFAAVIFTYYGNLFLGGLHTYA